MNGDRKTIGLPTETLPGLGLAEYTKDISAIGELFEAHGISTKNTRIERYADYLQNAPKGARVEGIFKNSKDPRFRHPWDWYLYVLREVNDLMWILRGVRTNPPAGLTEKLRIIVSGSDFSALDKNTEARNVQFELRIASCFCQAGCEVDLTHTDVIAVSKDYAFFVECKRVTKPQQLQRRLIEAAKQLKARMPDMLNNRPAYGIVAADVTKAVYAHDGLLCGSTAEFIGQTIQEKISALGRSLPEFQETPRIILRWLQIHISAVSILPAMPMSRLSSYMITNDNTDEPARRAWRYFDTSVYKAVSKADPRCEPSRPLTLRKKLALPTGTRICASDTVNEYLRTGQLVRKPPEEIAARMMLGDVTHDFTFGEVEILIANMSQGRKIVRSRPWIARLKSFLARHVSSPQGRGQMSSNHDEALCDLFAGLYAQRFPFNEIGPGLARENKK